MNILKTRAYRKAFAAYLRRGIPIHISLKAEQAATHYIWRTRGDDKVRPSHAANEGKVFSWNSPPPTGHPGVDYNCRCTAEAYVQGVSEYASQTLTEVASDNSEQWDNLRFLQHAYEGNGETVTLEETGHLANVIQYYFYEIIRKGRNSYNRVNAQIIDEARRQMDGDFTYKFENSYDEFGDYLYVFGSVTIGGRFTGTVHRQNGRMRIEGSVDFYFFDVFTDIVDLREILIGTSNPAETTPKITWITDLGGIFFPIIGNWKTNFQAEARQNEETSIYKWED